MWKRLVVALAMIGLVAGMGGTALASGSGSRAAGVLASVFGDTLSGSGPFGLQVLNSSTAANAYGVVGRLTAAGAGSVSAGIAGFSSGTNSDTSGVYGNSARGRGVYGVSSNNYGVYGLSTTGVGVFGLHRGTTGTNSGVQGETRSTDSNASGVRGYVAGTAPGSLSAGVRGEILATGAFSGAGLHGRHAGHGYGVYAESVGTSGTGVYASGGFYGAYTYASQPGSTAVYASGVARGVDGYSEATDGSTSTAYGVFGDADASNGGVGVYGRADGGSGVNYGVRGEVYSSDGYGGHFQNYATGNQGAGVQGQSSGATGATISSSFFAGGVEGVGGNGVIGQADRSSGYGVLGIQGSGVYAGYFSGAVHVTGNLSKASGSFKIDHPLDPANRYLYHSFVESPDMMNIYNGVVTLDGTGAATVTLPSYFGALNKEFRYTLTAIGGAAPNLHVAREVANNSFSIAGGTAGLRVSWQVTGIRQDTYANANRIQVEVDKPASERGRYLYPPQGARTMGLPIGAQQAAVAQPAQNSKPAPADTAPRLPR